MKELTLGRNSFLKVLSELERKESDMKDMITAYIIPKNPAIISKLPDQIGIYAGKIISRHPLGIVVFYCQEKKVNMLVFPPFPIHEEFFEESKFRTEQLREIFRRQYKLGIILLNLGEYAIGIFDGNNLVDSKTGKRFLRGKHGKGGMSQGRYLRLRRSNIGIFFNEFQEILKSKIESRLKDLDYVIYGGSTVTIKDFQKREGFVKKLNEKTLDRIIDCHEVSKKALEKIMFDVWKTRVVEL